MCGRAVSSRHQERSKVKGERKTDVGPYEDPEFLNRGTSATICDQPRKGFVSGCILGLLVE